jgi:ubiquinone/menaquinone biosynthesis C-methylase UbiE
MDLSKYNQKTPDINEGKPDMKGELLECKKKILDIALHKILQNVPAKILDIGPAAGWETKRLVEMFPNHEITALTLFKEEAVEIMRNANPHWVVKSDMHDMAVDSNQYKLVFASHVLEHSHSPYIALSEFYRVLEKNGIAFIVLPNANGYTALHTEKPKRLGSFPAHLFCPSIETMIEMAKHVGFTFEAYHEEPQYCEGMIHYINQIYIFRK